MKKHIELELKLNDWGNQIFGEHCDKNFRASIASLPNAWGDLPEDQLAGVDVLQTPGVAMSTQLSFGMTPKTLRLPKKGEMLLSVCGSPLGVYQEENLAAVHDTYILVCLLFTSILAMALSTVEPPSPPKKTAESTNGSEDAAS
uniref:Borealin C-terminal domain-containing protein n=1 Tax=Leersia perrieri TaxID=77586 RepID=A0A0D9X6C2_9ORYZ